MKLTPIQNPSTSNGKFLEPPLSISKFSSGYELHAGLIAMVQALPFSGHDNENPCQHLQEFEEMFSSLSILGRTRNS
jgi:hypothetical protein